MDIQLTQKRSKRITKTNIYLLQQQWKVAKLELTKFLGTPDGKKADYYRMAELHFSSVEQIEETMGSTEGQDTVNDLSNFATGGVNVIVGITETDS